MTVVLGTFAQQSHFDTMFLLLFIVLLCTSDYVRNVKCSPIRNETVNCPIQDEMEQGASSLIKAIQYIDANPETIEALLDTQKTIVEGDIVLSDDRNVVGRPWPEENGQISVAFTISPTIAGKIPLIQKAMAMVSEKTCISFHNRINESDYLFFKESKGCASYVGCTGGRQPVFIGPFCGVGNICHEILHSLGFHHEHTRTDREKYVEVNYDNIMQGMERNFNELEGITFELPYDISSILHYGGTFFSSNGKPTISVKGDTGHNMGQRSYMTELDIKRLRTLYECDSREQSTTNPTDDYSAVSHNQNTTQTPL